MSVFLRDPPGRGNVYACPHCGDVWLLQCFHEETGSVRTVAMNAAKAAHLRRHGTLRQRDRIQFKCDGCGHAGPVEIGMQIGTGNEKTLCARCAGRTERQVMLARRQLA